METPFSQNRAKRPKRKVNLSQRFIDTVKPEPTRSLYWDTKQDCLALSVEPTGSKRFVLIYRFRGDGRFHGKVRWYTFPRGVGLSDARTLAQVKMGEVASGIDVQAIKTSPRNQITFQTLATRYVEEYAKANNRSWKQGQRIINGYVIPKLGSWLVEEIQRSDIRGIIRSLTQKGNPQLANLVLANTSALFSWCLDEEVVSLPGNPAHGIKRNPPSKEGRAYSDDEIRALWPAFDQGDLYTSCILKLMLLTGQRGDEVRRMRWEDLDSSWWTIRTHKRSKVNDAKPHRVFLTETALDIFDELDRKDDGWVFPGKRKDWHIRATSQSSLAAIKAASGIDDFKPHGLRHTVATGLSNLGVPKETISKILNHAEGGVTKRYLHSEFDSEKKSSLIKWERRFLAVIDEDAPDSNVIFIVS